MYVVREELSVRDGRKYIPIYSRAIELEHALAERVERTSEHLRAILAIWYKSMREDTLAPSANESVVFFLFFFLFPGGQLSHCDYIKIVIIC